MKIKTGSKQINFHRAGSDWTGEKYFGTLLPRLYPGLPWHGLTALFAVYSELFQLGDFIEI